MTAGGATAIPRAPSFESSDYSNAQSPRHLVLLSVLTFGLYEFYWFYRNWRDLREHAGADVSPGWRTVGLLVPFVNIFMVHHQLSLVREVAESDGDTVYYAPGALTLAFFGLAILSNLTMLWALSLLTVVPLLPVQATLNRYWARRQPGLRVREDFESYELLLMMAGAMMTLAVVASSLGS